MIAKSNNLGTRGSEALKDALACVVFANAKAPSGIVLGRWLGKFKGKVVKLAGRAYRFVNEHDEETRRSSWRLEEVPVQGKLVL